jgi:hypothetical protein
LCSSFDVACAMTSSFCKATKGVLFTPIFFVEFFSGCLKGKIRRDGRRIRTLDNIGLCCVFVRTTDYPLGHAPLL